MYIFDLQCGRKTKNHDTFKQLTCGLIFGTSEDNKIILKPRRLDWLVTNCSNFKPATGDLPDFKECGAVLAGAEEVETGHDDVVYSVSYVVH
jgi:hypothetical protein